MNAIIIYEECDSARKAHALLQEASDRAGVATQWTVRPWRLEALRQPLLAQAALRDAVGAHLLVLAVQRPMHVPSWLLTWLELWAGRRHVQDAALAVFEGPRGETLSSIVSTELAELAQRHGLSFIGGEVCPAQGEAASVEVGAGLHEPEAIETSRLARMLEETPRGDLRGWGIND